MDKRQICIKFAREVSAILKIAAPSIRSVPVKQLRTSTQIAALTPDGILIRNDIGVTPELFFAIAHELRHAYQLENDRSLHDYHTSDQLDIDEYNAQPLEVDANAFAAVPTSIKLLSEDSEVAESHSLASLKTGSHLDGKAALSFGYLTEQDEYVVMMRQDDGGYRRKSYPADGTVVYEDAEADDARVEVVDQYVVIRETHEFPIVGEWTRDRRKFLKCEIRIHVPAGSIAQGEYDIT